MKEVIMKQYDVRGECVRVDGKTVIREEKRTVIKIPDDIKVIALPTNTKVEIDCDSGWDGSDE